MPNQSIEEIFKKNTKAWMEIPGVLGTALGIFNDKPCIKVFASKLSTQIKTQIPEQIEGYRIIVELTGPFEART